MTTAFHERPAPDTGRLAREATRDARGAREAAEDAAARRHTRQTVAAMWVARAVEHVVRAMQPDADPRSWRWRRTEATDCLRIAEDTLRETMLDDLIDTPHGPRRGILGSATVASLPEGSDG